MTLTLALPSKGRLKDEALALLTRAGYTVRLPDDARTYRAAVEGEPRLEIAFLSASEIARELGAGRIDLGVTGEDLVREDVPDSESRVALLVRLGFCHADVVVAVPQAWFDDDTMADLGEVAAGVCAPPRPPAGLP
nr:ATP phosphoribosyltransferase [Rhizobiaceae bacterium]